MSDEREMQMLQRVARRDPDFVAWVRQQAVESAMTSRLADGPVMYRQQGRSLALEHLAAALERAKQ